MEERGRDAAYANDHIAKKAARHGAPSGHDRERRGQSDFPIEAGASDGAGEVEIKEKIVNGVACAEHAKAQMIGLIGGGQAMYTSPWRQVKSRAKERESGRAKSLVKCEGEPRRKRNYRSQAARRAGANAKERDCHGTPKCESARTTVSPRG